MTRSALVLIASIDVHLLAALMLFGGSGVADAHKREPSRMGEFREKVIDVEQLEPETEIRGSPNPNQKGAAVPVISKSKPNKDRSPPPPLSKASQALTAESSKEAVPVASAERFPGGLTASSGVSPDPALRGDPLGVIGGQGLLFGGGGGGGNGGGTLAHPAEVNWGCPWPASARDAAIFQARVHLVVGVTAKGGATSVTVLDDPAPGFAFPQAAKECAMRQRYRPARDRSGRAVDGFTGRFATIFYLY